MGVAALQMAESPGGEGYGHERGAGLLLMQKLMGGAEVSALLETHADHGIKAVVGIRIVLIGEKLEEEVGRSTRRVGKTASLRHSEEGGGVRIAGEQLEIFRVQGGLPVRHSLGQGVKRCRHGFHYFPRLSAADWLQRKISQELSFAGGDCSLRTGDVRHR